MAGRVFDPDDFYKEKHRDKGITFSPQYLSMQAITLCVVMDVFVSINVTCDVAGVPRLLQP